MPDQQKSFALLWFGWVLAIFGVVLVILSFFMETTTSTEYGVSSGILNVGFLQRQMMMFQLGLASAIVGAIGIFLSAAINRLCGALPQRQPVADEDDAQKPADDDGSTAGLGILIIVALTVLVGVWMAWV